jgi:hypothetical protein
MIKRKKIIVLMLPGVFALILAGAGVISAMTGYPLGNGRVTNVAPPENLPPQDGYEPQEVTTGHSGLIRVTKSIGPIDQNGQTVPPPSPGGYEALKKAGLLTTK